MSLVGDLRDALAVVGRRVGGEYEEDAWGFDADYVRAVAPLVDLLYDRWWRVEAGGLEGLPARGRALVVANHAGVLPYDALMMATAIRRGVGRGAGGGALSRDARFLAGDRAFELPYASPALRRLGGVPDSAHNARQLLEQEHLVLAFPEYGGRASKPYSERYRLERFGRGGFIEVALRTQSPVIPCAVVGSEEVHPLLAQLPLLPGRLMPLPVPLPLPSKWLISFGEPIVLSHPPEAAEDRALVLSLSDRVRERIQQSVYETLIRRKAAFL
jgi:1-acyl-sn-glycerol-3-phosphate acyltransferase